MKSSGKSSPKNYALIILFLISVTVCLGIIFELRYRLERVQQEFDQLLDGLGDRLSAGSNSSNDFKDFCSKESRKLKKELARLERVITSSAGQGQDAECSKRLIVLQSNFDSLRENHGLLKEEKSKLERKLNANSEGSDSVCDSKLNKVKSELLSLQEKYDKEVSEKKGSVDADSSCDEQTEELKKKMKHVQSAFDRQMEEKVKMAKVLKACEGSNMWNETVLNTAATKAAQDAIAQCGKSNVVSTFGKIELTAGNKLYGCEATEEEMAQYLNYTKRADCPDDWFFVQKLIFFKNCHALPKRFCFAKTSSDFSEPLPFPNSLWNQSSLVDENVRWDLHYYRSFSEIIGRSQGDCKNCFNLTKESTRWRGSLHGTIPVRKVVAMKQGSLRIGLDLGGGTGSFAARMATYNCTILTSAMNTETLGNSRNWKGLPYMETIALRGLVPLHLPHQARLPFFDNTLDIIHTMNTIKYLTMPQFEQLLFDWDRVLRPGGIIWFEMFYAPVSEMPMYITIIELFKYKKLYWVLTPKTDAGERGGEHVYLNCVLEKPERP